MAQPGMPSMTISDVLAPIELGTLVSCILFGAMCTQGYSYMRHQFNDSRVLKSLLAAVVCVETVHMAFLFVHLYWLTVVNFGKRGNLDRVSWSFASTFSLTSLSDSLVQGYYAYRIHGFSKRWIFLLFPFVLILTRLTEGVYVSARMIMVGQMSEFGRNDKYLCTLNLALKLAIDSYITVCMCWLLFRARAVSARTRSLVDRLIVWTAEVGFLNSICSLIMLVLILSLDNQIWMFFVVISPRIISNSLFAMLNARASIHDTDSDRGRVVFGTLSVMAYATSPTATSDFRIGESTQEGLGHSAIHDEDYETVVKYSASSPTAC
jgi:hypothetical protein